MIQYKFYLIKHKNKTKNIIFEAENLTKAREFVYATYPGWEVSMFWPV